MPTIEVYARWQDVDGNPQRQFVTSLSSSADEFRHARTERWLDEAIQAAAHIEAAHRDIALTMHCQRARDQKDASVQSLVRERSDSTTNGSQGEKS